MGGQLPKYFVLLHEMCRFVQKKIMFLTTNCHGVGVGERGQVPKNFCHELHEMCRSVQKNHVSTSTHIGMGDGAQVTNIVLP